MKWVIGSQIGKGAQGTVFEAWKSGKSESVFVAKVFKRKKSLAKVLTEASLQQKAANVHAAPAVIEVIEEIPYKIIMQKMAGSVHDLLRRQNGKLTQEQQHSIVQLCDRLDGAKVYHNDYNSSNLMVTDSAEFRFVDYGLSRTFDDKGEAFTKDQQRLWTMQPNRLFGLQYLLNSATQGLVPRKHLLFPVPVIQNAIKEAHAMAQTTEHREGGSGKSKTSNHGPKKQGTQPAGRPASKQTPTPQSHRRKSSLKPK